MPESDKPAEQEDKSDVPVMGGEPLGEQEAREFPLPDRIPVLPTRQFVLYPHLVLPAVLSSERDIKLVNEVAIKDRLIACVAQSDTEAEVPTPDQLHRVGCAAGVLKMLKFPDDSTRLILQGLSRIRVKKFVQTEPYLVAEVERIESAVEESEQLQAMRLSLVDQFQTLVGLSQNLPDELKVAVLNIDDPGRLVDVVSSALNLELGQRQRVLETLDVGERIKFVLGLLSRELHMLELSEKIQKSVKSDMEKGQRDFLLRQQLKAIQEELGEGDPQAAEIKELREALTKAKLPEEAHKEAERELDRLSRMNPAAAEYTVARTYLDWILALPWNAATRDKLNVARAEKVLDADHYGLEKVKQRVVEYIAVRKLKKDMRGPILCFVGPPGTGKTSLGRSIARALGRKFVRISLGGVRDEAEIRGHRRTYVGALPGRIIQGLRKAGRNNPVFMLDEVDKLGADFRGDPSSALLEVLDPEQNFSFSDHYLDVAFDLSKVMFITTANVLDTIPGPLRDRMEVLELPGYTVREKLAIARKYLIPRQLEQHGLTSRSLALSDEVLHSLIRDYTREAGLRNLEREIASLCRKVATHKAREGRKFRKRVIRPEDLVEMLGPARFIPEVAERVSEPGVATGLAWTPSGGEILFVEATRMAGSGRLTLTGHLGEVMKESAQAAMSYVRAHAKDIGLDPKQFSKLDVHVHVPTGAIPKDGPSAGVTLVMALVSMFTGRPVRSNVAMTGEMTLRGRVLPVGGIKEKVLAARRAGIDTVLMPAQNEKDLIEIKDEAREGMEFVLVDRIEEMVPVVFEGPSKPKASKKSARRSKSGKGTAPGDRRAAKT